MRARTGRSRSTCAAMSAPSSSASAELFASSWPTSAQISCSSTHVATCLRRPTNSGVSPLATRMSCTWRIAVRENPCKKRRISGSSRRSNSPCRVPIALPTPPRPKGAIRLSSAGRPHSAKNGFTFSENSFSVS
ncbi:hypothetical protein BE20_00980 [Sorangium cellulosum]|nr:hypothetical protein BE20_00980 [Sorangium cellulosum]